MGASPLLCLLRSSSAANIAARPTGSAGLEGEVMDEAAGVDKEGADNSEGGLLGGGASALLSWSSSSPSRRAA